MDQTIAECDVVDQGSGLVGDRVKIAQAHVEIDLCAGRISGGGVNAKRITIRISKTKMVDDESQREALDVDDLRVFRGGVQPGGVVPLHFNEALLTGCIDEGQLTLKTKKGKSTTFMKGDSFVLSADTT